MKAVKFIGMIVLSLFIGLNFASCSNDDVEGDKLAGEWVLTGDESTITDKNTNEELVYPGEDFVPNQEKIIIKELGDDKYSVQWYGKENGEWEEDGYVAKFTLEGNKLVPEDTEDGEMTCIVDKLTSSELVLIIDEEDEDYIYYEKMTFARM